MNKLFPVGSLVEIKATGVRLLVWRTSVPENRERYLLANTIPESSDQYPQYFDWYDGDRLELVRAPADSNIFVADADVIDPEVEESFRQYWQELVMKDGQYDLVQLKRELHDYALVLGEVPKVYDYVTGGAISKPHTEAAMVIAAAEDYTMRLMNGEKV